MEGRGRPSPSIKARRIEAKYGASPTARFEGSASGQGLVPGRVFRADGRPGGFLPGSLRSESLRSGRGRPVTAAPAGATVAERGTTTSIPKASALLAVLGVVYGDIGTSPLYAFKTSLQLFHDLPITQVEIMGILSLIFWSLVLIVTVKYVLLVMRADNHGEGGILALMALAQRVSEGSRLRRILGLVGIAGACLFFGDGIITPAISVLSAVEGLEVVTPSAAQYVLPISAAVIVMLFAVQWRGTGSVGRMFGPIMAVWFVAIGALGLLEIVQHPYVLLSVSPTYAIALCVHYKVLAFVVLGAVVLCVTGAEALYADMGHFGRAADPADLDGLRAAEPGAELFRPGRADPQRSQGDREPVLPARAGLAAPADGDPGHRRHGDRQPGADLRRLFDHPASACSSASCRA